LRDSVRRHLIADVPVGVFLSSGMDSTTLTALASEEINQLHAVTLGFDEYRDSPADEVPLARKVAAHYGCTHHVSSISRHDFDEELTAILHAMDQPSIDGVNTYFVARAARRAGLKVALSGVGGDELLGGYPSFRQIPALVPRLRPFSLVPGLGRFMRIVSVPLAKRSASPKYASLLEYGGSYGGAYLCAGDCSVSLGIAAVPRWQIRKGRLGNAPAYRPVGRMAEARRIAACKSGRDGNVPIHAQHAAA